MSLALVTDKADTLPTEEDRTQRQRNLLMALTPLQQRVARGVLEGKSQSQAYRDAGGKAKTDIAQSAGASEFLSNPKVKAFMEAVYDTQLTASIMTRDEVLERLSEIGRSDDPRNVIAAIRELSKMQDWNKEPSVPTVNTNIGVICVPEDKTMEEMLAQYTVVDVD